MTDPAPARRQSYRFLILYALAWAGGSIAYVPFLTLLLPVRISVLVGSDAGVGWLAYIGFFGAIAASLGHIGFGYLSDITRRRRLWIWIGLGISCFLLQTTGRATSLTGLIALIVAWQLALNMMLAPLAAWAGDCVPDRQKGLLGGLLAFAPGMGALSAAFITIPDLADADTRLLLVAAIVVFCVLPVLLFGTPSHLAELNTARVVQPAVADADDVSVRRGIVPRMWLARLAVQIAEAALFSYLFYWFNAIDPAMGDNRTARVLSFVLILSAPLALFVGRWADLRNRPIKPLVICAALSSIGLFGMAFANSQPTAIAAYAVFGLASSVFLALHSAETLRFLPRPDRRGRDLGLFNLTNTTPSLVMPWLTLALVPYFGFSGLFILLSVLSIFASLILANVRLRT